MSDRLSHLKLAMDLGFQLGQGKKVDLREMADKHLTKPCPVCRGKGQVWPPRLTHGRFTCRTCVYASSCQDFRCDRERCDAYLADESKAQRGDTTCDLCGGAGHVRVESTE